MAHPCPRRLPVLARTSRTGANADCDYHALKKKGSGVITLPMIPSSDRPSSKAETLFFVNLDASTVTATRSGSGPSGGWKGGDQRKEDFWMPAKPSLPSFSPVRDRQQAPPRPGNMGRHMHEQREADDCPPTTTSRPACLTMSCESRT